MKRDLPRLVKSQISKGFTLIELLVVIAILGVLAVVLISILDPVDKIRASSDAGSISTITQLGKGNDAYAANNNNLYPVSAAASNFGQVVSALNTAGESKYTTVAQPTGYTYSYMSPATCVTATPANCTSYVFYTNLLSKKYASTPYFWYSNGKGCTKAAAPTASTDAC